MFTDVVQPERRVTCTQTTEAAKKAKKEPKPIPAASLELVVTDDGNEWHLIGFEPDGRNDMAIRCTPADKRSDNATYAFSTVDGFTDRANTGNGIAIIGTALGIGLALWTFIAPTTAPPGDRRCIRLSPTSRHGTAPHDDLIDLLPSLSDDDWSKPTDLPGWSVHDVAAHLAHLEAVLAGHDPSRRRRAAGGQVARPPTTRRPGVDARADRSPEELIDELRQCVEARIEQLRDLPDPSSKPDTTPGGVDWTWEVLLRNRAIDMWCHEQDIRRAVDRPGWLGTGGAQVTTHSFAAGMPFVLGKRVAPPAGTSVVWRITGEVPLEIGAVIGDDGRAAPQVADDPTATLTLTSEAFTVLAAGRRTPDQVDVEVDGDEELGRRRARSDGDSPNELEHGRHPRPDRQARGHHRRHRWPRVQHRPRARPARRRAGGHRPQRSRRPTTPSRDCATRCPDVTVDVVSLDLASLADAKRAASDVVAALRPRRHPRQQRRHHGDAAQRTTVDGFELQIGTNHLGHFAWTATLWPLLKASDARIVTVSSLMHARATGIDLRSLTPEGSPRRYWRWKSYSESKLANLSFALELNRRVKAAGLGVVSVAAHPGYALTNLQKTGTSIGGGVNALAGTAFQQVSRIVAQSAEMGAWPLLLAATDPSLTGGEYVGPSSLGQTRGRPEARRHDPLGPRRGARRQPLGGVRGGHGRRIRRLTSRM